MEVRTCHLDGLKMVLYQHCFPRQRKLTMEDGEMRNLGCRNSLQDCSRRPHGHEAYIDHVTWNDGPKTDSGYVWRHKIKDSDKNYGNDEEDIFEVRDNLFIDEPDPSDIAQVPFHPWTMNHG